MSVEFRALALGPLGTNCYIVADTASGNSVIIDPAAEIDRIESVIGFEGWRVRKILLTHSHFDHCFCAVPLAAKYNVPIAMHEQDVAGIGANAEIAAMFHDMSEYAEFTPDEIISGGDKLLIGESEISVLHTPGHTPGGVCFVTEVGVFCGDTIFAGSVGRTDFPGGSYSQLISSIRTRILTLPDDTPLYPGHGNSTTVGQERRTNPFVGEGVVAALKGETMMIKDLILANRSYRRFVQDQSIDAATLVELVDLARCSAFGRQSAVAQVYPFLHTGPECPDFPGSVVGGVSLGLGGTRGGREAAGIYRDSR